MSEKKSGMFDKVPFIQKLKNIKHIELIIIALFVIVLAVVYMSSSGGSKNISSNIQSSNLEDYGEYLETKLERVLKDIDGAGNLKVMVTFNGRITYEYAKEKEEVTTSSSVTGGTNSKTTTNEEILIISQNGKETPIIIKEIYPEISGVLIVCSGASNVAVRLNIISAVETLLGVDANNIQVLVGEK